ncbi:Proteinase inhibitor [Linum perenne]
MSSGNCPGKNSWPELLGRNGDAAAAVVERENRMVDAIVVREGTAVNLDFRCDRVWVWVNGDRVVTSVPRIG